VETKQNGTYEADDDERDRNSTDRIARSHNKRGLDRITLDDVRVEGRKADVSSRPSVSNLDNKHVVGNLTIGSDDDDGRPPNKLPGLEAKPSTDA
jgi:hypothetical protein